MNENFPYTISPLDASINRELLEYFKGRKTGFVQTGPKKYLLPQKYYQHANKFYNFELRKDDLWIVTYPRSGTSLTQEILWLINNNLDYDTSAKIPLNERFPFFEFNILSDDEFLKEVAELNGNSLQAMEAIKLRNTPGYEIGSGMKSPRHFKTHLPLSLLPPKLLDICKVVYIARNPYDVSVSFYHHNKRVRTHDFKGDFNKYWEFFEKDLVVYTPYWQHIEEGWQFKDNPNLLFIFYENLIMDKPSVIRQIGKFLNKELSEVDINKLIAHIDYGHFQKNVPLMRKFNIAGLENNVTQPKQRGNIGGKEEFAVNSELKHRADQWYIKNSSQIGVEFPI